MSDDDEPEKKAPVKAAENIYDVCILSVF